MEYRLLSTEKQFSNEKPERAQFMTGF